jgi:putative DNA primase/helicase
LNDSPFFTTTRYAPPPSGADNGADVRPPAFSDEDLALRFAAQHADHLRFVAGWGKWMSWTGERWRKDETYYAFNLARHVCREAADECADIKAKKAIASDRTVAATVHLARADRRLAATTEQWDADPWLLNTPDGVVDLRTGHIRPARSEDYMTQMTVVGAIGDCPRWKAFLNQIMSGDAGVVAYLQRVCGYCLTGDTTEQAMFFGHGRGANGKGVLLQTVSHILGDYCKIAAIETFTETNNDRHPTELARLHNARLVTATETEGGRNWAESRLKLLTGGDIITAHFMRKDDFEYVPRFKLLFSGNHKPSLRNVGVAMQRRLNMIPFAVVIPESDRDPQFSDKLKPEWPGILKWMIDGCLDWQRRGLDPPDAVKKATAHYFTTQDSFSRWLEECCERDPNAWTATAALFPSWRTWAERAGVRFGDVKTFSEAMTDNGFAWKHTKKGNGYVGLRIAEDPPHRHWQEQREL